MYGLAYPVIDPYMGIMVGWKAFISAVVGGIGNIRGAMIGGFILGAVEIWSAAFLPSTYRDFVAFTLLLVLLDLQALRHPGQTHSRKRCSHAETLRRIYIMLIRWQVAHRATSDS